MPSVRFWSSSEMTKNVQQILLEIFSKAVSSVLPANLLSSHFKYNSNEDVLKIFSTSYNLCNKNVYVIGAGKAVPGMASEVMKILGNRVSSGIFSVPVGSTNNYNLSSYGCTSIRLYEGALNNQPDTNSVNATKEIIELVKTLDENCFLLVLMSGGSSALLCSPLPPVTLEQKAQLIQKLAAAGADIVQLNKVRKRLSTVKGGKLAILAHPAEVGVLLISDIVGDHLGFIGSGPTCVNNDKHLDAANIIQKFCSLEELPESIKSVLYSPLEGICFPHNSRVSNFLLGNNKVALDAAKKEAENLGFNSFVLSDAVQGDVETVSFEYCQLITLIIKLLSKTITAADAKEALRTLTSLSINSERTLDDLTNVNIPVDSQGLCFICGGEPTVRVSGSGKGGRSQHLALTLSMNYHSEKQKTVELQEYDVTVLCGGTDGMDGPTDAAGAIGYDNLVADAHSQHLSAEVYLRNNDSYNFFSTFSNGRNHIKIGHTSTNVMDIHVIIIKKKEEEGLTLFIC